MKFVGLLQRCRNITLPSVEPSLGALTKEYIIILKLSSFKSSDKSDNINEIEDTLYIVDRAFFIHNILKAKINFTLLCTEYIYARSDSKQMKFCH